jgi:hypothetical protein
MNSNKSTSIKDVLNRLKEFKRKYYLNLLIKGLLLSSAIVISTFLIINFAEYFGRFNSLIRGGLLLLFVAGSVAVIYLYVLRPIFFLVNIQKPLSDKQAAKEIGQFFPEVSDKLINVLQLSDHAEVDTSLVNASIEQKSKSLKLVNFTEAVQFGENKKYLKYALPPLLLVLFISAISPNLFSSSTERIVKFQDNFMEEAPFDFRVVNDKLVGFKNQDFVLSVTIDGDALPEEVFVFYNKRKYKMSKENENTYSFIFNKLSEAIDFNLTAAGFSSKEYELKVETPPNLLSFDITLTYPTYLAKKPEQLNNVGNLVLPEGTLVSWNFITADTDSVSIKFEMDDILYQAKNISESSFTLSKQIRKTTSYDIYLRNRYVSNQSDINYYINVIPDKLPVIDFTQLRDSSLYNYVLLGGNIDDDYGLSKFKLFYKKQEDVAYTSLNIPFNKNQTSQNFYYQFDVASLNLERGDKLSYYLQLWDNDGVNGNKSVKTGTLTFEVPSLIDYSKEIDKDVDKIESKMEKLLKKSKDLKKAIEKLDKKLKVNDKLGFQEKKDLEDILQQKKELQRELEKLVEDFKKVQEKQERFNEPSPQTQEKMEQLQELMKDLMKDENSELYKQLEELLKNNEQEKVNDKLDEIKKNERNLDRNIDRTLKLFKNLQLKQKVESAAQDLEKLADKQEKLADESENKSKDPAASKDLSEKQEKLNEEFKEQQEKIKDIEKLSKELKKDFDAQEEDQESVEENQQEAQEQLDSQEPSKASKPQKKAAKSMRNMAKAMSAQMQSAEMKQLDLDIDALRDILENVVKLSFDQERILNGIRGMNSADPRFIDLSQEQLKLVDDAKIVEDSLYSLSQKVMQIESFVTKEVTSMNNYMNESLLSLKERKLNIASAKQQFSMTSINNLALLLSDTFKQMQQMMMAMSMPGGGSSGKKGDMPSTGMGEKQKQLNKRLEGLGKSGQGGKELSEELAQLAQEQAKLRRELSQLQDKLNGTKEGQEVGKQLSELQKEMDESEKEIVNKRITPTLIKRQKEIEVRLLEAEKAIKEQELDPKRKSNTGRIINNTPPKEIDEFIKKKAIQKELLRFTPPTFTPFYKSKTNSYLKKIQ